MKKLLSCFIMFILLLNITSCEKSGKEEKTDQDSYSEFDIDEGDEGDDEGYENVLDLDFKDYETNEAPPLFFYENYYLDGDSSNYSIIFQDNGEADVETVGSSFFCDYEIDGKDIKIYNDGDLYLTLQILYPTMLVDSEGAVYALEGIHEATLEMQDRYYLNGDVASISLHFWENGDMDIELSGDEALTYRYTDHESESYVTLDDANVSITIVDPYILELDGYLFIREP